MRKHKSQNRRSHLLLPFPRRENVQNAETRAGCTFCHHRPGVILITTIWIILILSAMALVLARSMRVEVMASGNRMSAQQASTIELGAEQYVLSAVDGCGGDAVAVLQTPAEQLRLGSGYFWILQPYPANDNTYAFGITDECSKLNLNVAGDAELAALPGMTQDVADSIIDWRDTDENVTGQGAESQYYQLQPRPYKSKNGPFETVEELYLVKGVRDALLWGSDLDHNGIIDSAEQQAGGIATTFNLANDSGRGIVPFVTVWGKEPNTDTSAKPRLNISTLASPQQLREVLLKKLPEPRVDQILERAMATRTFRNVFDFALKTGLKSSELGLVADSLTTSTAKALPGLVNVYTASKQVLLCLPGITQTEADAIVAQRPVSSSGTGGSGLGGSKSASTAASSGISWVIDAITPPKAAAIGGQITGKSYFYSADIVAASGNGRAFKRVRIVVDARSSPPIIVYRKEMSQLGWPLLPEIRTAMQSGQALPAPTGQGTGGANGLQQQ